MKYSKSKRMHATLTLVFAATVFIILLLSTCIALVLIVLGYRFGFIYFDFLKPFNNTIPYVFFGVISLVIGIVLSLLVGAIYLKPIKKFVNATNRLAKGDFSVRLDIKTPYEFGELTKSFNNMAQELGSIEMLRSDFINNFSHEFKTPIVSILGFAKLLKKETLTDEERNECIDIIVSESERLSELSTSVLNLTKVEKQAIITDKKSYNLSEQLRRVILLLESKWSAKHLDIEFDGPECNIIANEELLNQVWINLLDNAIKFSPEYASVTVSVKADSAIYVSFKDYGCGINQEAQKRIFDKFYQEDRSHSTPGNGLGLALCKNIVEKHGGTISVTSEEGKGSIFTVKLHR